MSDTNNKNSKSDLVKNIIATVLILGILAVIALAVITKFTAG